MAEPTLQSDPPKLRALNYAPPLRLSERVGRYLPRRERVADFLKTLVWVAPLTLLIWVYAEREQAVTQPGITVPIEVLTGSQDRLVTLRRPAEKLIIVELSGSRASLDRALALLKPTRDGAPIKISVDEKLRTGGKELDTVGAIAKDAIFVNNGITVKSAQPPYLFVDIDAFEERDVPVRVPADVSPLLVEQAAFEPKTVHVRAPSQVLKAAEAAGPLFVEADLGTRPEIKKEGQKTLTNVGVYWPGRKENVTLTPAAVAATLDVKRQDGTYSAPSLPINLETPAGFADKYKVVYLPTIPNVEVKGPAEQIEAIRKGDFKLKPRLEVMTFDPTRTQIKRRLKMDLPQGVTVVTDGPTDKLEWTFTVEDR